MDFNSILAFGDVIFTYKVTVLLLSVSLLVMALEDLQTWKVYSNSGILSWNIGKLGARWSLKGSFAKLMNWLLKDNIFKTTVYFRLIGAGLMLVFVIFNFISPALIIFLFFLHILISIRSPYGLDGAYQMQLVILFGLSIGCLFLEHSRVCETCLLFICGQLLIAYFISGFTKLLSPVWRTSLALNSIFGTKTFGHPFLFKLIMHRARLTLILSWTVFIAEMGIFIVVFLFPPLVVPFLIFGFIFHAINAIFMGLNDFLLTFPAAYPAVLFLLNKLVLS